MVTATICLIATMGTQPSTNYLTFLLSSLKLSSMKSSISKSLSTLAEYVCSAGCRNYCLIIGTSSTFPWSSNNSKECSDRTNRSTSSSCSSSNQPYINQKDILTDWGVQKAGKSSLSQVTPQPREYHMVMGINVYK